MGRKRKGNSWSIMFSGPLHGAKSGLVGCQPMISFNGNFDERFARLFLHHLEHEISVLAENAYNDFIKQGDPVVLAVEEDTDHE